MRSCFARFVFVLVVNGVFAVGAVVAAEVPATRPAEERLNVLVLSVEDMSPWLGCYGDKTAPTPNIDRLARQGTRYTNVFATTPVCAPARHTLITGLYATSTGAMHMRNNAPSKLALERDPHAYDNIPSYEAVPPPQVRCFSELLRTGGYYATNNAKEDYQFRAPPTAWDESSNRAHYRNRRAGQPFFAVFNCNFTHESQAFGDAPKRTNVVKAADVKVPPYYPDTYLVRQTLAQTYNNIATMDQWVGEKLAELEKEGLADSTIVIFYSDHGVGLPRGKRSCYDSGLRVPLIVRFPDEARGGAVEDVDAALRAAARARSGGEVDDRLISFIDFAPTFLSLAGIKPPAYMPGRPFLGRYTSDPSKYVFATLDRVDVQMDRVRTVGDGRYRYVRNLMPHVPHIMPIAFRDRIPMMKDIFALKGSGKATPQQWQMAADGKPPEEFYDTQADPHEVRNVIDDAKHADRIQAMRDALDRWTIETVDLGRVQPEARLVRDHLWPPDGEQPSTAPPMPTLDGSVLTITCETEGASIGYRQRGEKAWKVYARPVEIDPATPVEVVAQRIGFRRSAIVELATAR